MTPDIQAGRALTLLSILAGLLGFIVALLGGGVANCSGAPPDPSEPATTSSSRKKVLKLYIYHVDWIFWPLKGNTEKKQDVAILTTVVQL